MDYNCGFITRDELDEILKKGERWKDPWVDLITFDLLKDLDDSNKGKLGSS